jgi:hypothetical protein
MEKIWWEKTVEYFYISKHLHSQGSPRNSVSKIKS